MHHTMARDYYDILGISRSVTPDELKSAYRKLAFKLHPDRNKAADASTKFSEVQQAYDVLSDPKTRALYDRHGDGWQAYQNPGFDGAPSRSGRSSSNPSAGPRPTQGGYSVNGMNFDQEDLSSIFDAVFGDQAGNQSGNPSANAAGKGPKSRGKARPGTRAEPFWPSSMPKPEPIRHELRVPFDVIITGATRAIRLTEDGITREIEVRIPQAIDDAAILRLANVAGTKATPRDVLLTIRVDPHPLWRRGEHTEIGKGLDLWIDLPLNIAEAVTGATILIPTPKGKGDVKIPASTPSGRSLRLRGQGLTATDGRVGDVYIVARIVPPTVATLTPEDYASLAIMVSRDPSPRSGPGWQ